MSGYWERVSVDSWDYQRDFGYVTWVLTRWVPLPGQLTLW